MTRKVYAFLFSLFVCSFAFPLWAVTLHHDLTVHVYPSESRIEVEDRITLTDEMGEQFVIALHDGMEVLQHDASVQVQDIGTARLGEVGIRRYAIRLPEGRKNFTLKYQGEVFHPVRSSQQGLTSDLEDSAGLVSEDGVFLSHGSAWYPLFENSPSLSFKLETNLPAKWKSVSQGERLVDEASEMGSRTVWQELAPQEEIYLIAAQFTEYKKITGAVESLVFLRQPDQGLAQRFLDVTAQYIEMYRQLIGPYPYSKFALIENFWQSGFGMPSFTLLGSKVIRLPFIVHSSYPHEILHNWWGNGVYVDYSQGNWAEGLTAYLADHLIQEQQQRGRLARRALLQNYTDFVTEQKEFPLSAFRSRHSASSASIGYGKAQMLFHMLRLKIGDEAFVKGLHRLYARYKFKEAGYSDLQKIFSGAANEDLSAFFQQWVSRVGSPELVVKNIGVDKTAEGWRLGFQLSQQQVQDAYQLNIPIAVTLRGEQGAYQETLSMTQKTQSYEVVLSAEPLRLDIDPEFDLFRRLDRAEIPPALSQAFGDDNGLIVLPSQASPALLQAYRGFAATWQGASPGLSAVLDNELASLPEDKAVWLLGWDNLFVDVFQQSMADYMKPISPGNIDLQGNQVSMNEHAVIAVGRNEKTDKAIAWVAATNAKAIPGLARKLPHYRRYSYLAFTGDEPTNTLKGQWPVLNSPMTALLDEQRVVARGELKERVALAQLPTLFDTDQLMEDIAILAAPEMMGRGVGTEGLDKAADAIATMFQQAGLKPGNVQENSYFQTWTQPIEGLEGEVTLKNVIAYLPGSNPKYQDESVVIAAHYDHLGLGWPNAREEYKGQVHLGADDNASGVAVMMSLARMAADGWQPERSVVFIAFTAEESGLIGSQYYVNNPQPFALEKMIGMINLDTVGRLGKAPVTVFGVGSAREWEHIFRGIGFVTGVKIKSVKSDLGSSDQKSFHDKGVPAVQLFAAAHPDFHTPNDTIDKLDVPGMVKMAMVLKEAVEYLATRAEPMTVQLDTAKMKSSAQRTTRPQGRKVSLGTVPDFTYQGQGVLLSDVVPGSPAQKSGIKTGDVISRVNGEVVEDLAGFSNELRKLSPGDMVNIEYIRDGQVNSVQLKALER